MVTINLACSPCEKFLAPSLPSSLPPKGTGGWKKVIAAIGHEILLDNTGEVNRPLLGQIVFSDPSKRQLLNRLLAPYISEGIFLEIKRLVTRDAISEEHARNRINAQMELDSKREKADIVIDNSGSLVETKVEFEKVFMLVETSITANVR
ncbi:hypothetical protein MKW98_020517 [Papaver atlanticum]|uniref:Dephospho-CoA kinase n=1 Tax=Papaver atlanticum TaxID=357466 RepID=A0AAD4SMP2_9MAGN|nr:hypothetical protein MKW98_020517 [Papaver atlanticum]